jgi:hypothetical protein
MTVPSSRFQIEEMVSQDAHGAVFLALDAETGREVLLQRFFPFGAGEGGLEGDELSSYDQAIVRMRELEHPHLRRVIGGGCDPVDGIPFMVTESRSAMSLREFQTHSVLNAAQGRLLAESALELLIWLEQSFGQSADWLALHAEDVEVIGEVESFRFCVDPMKWLGLRKGPGAVKELAALVEECMGWTGRVVTGSTAGMLSGWMRTAKTRELTPAQALTVLRGGQVETSVPAPVSNAPVLAAPVLAAPPSPSYQAPMMSARSGGHAIWYVLGSLVVAGVMTVTGIKWFQGSRSAKETNSVTAAETRKTTKSKKKTGQASVPVAATPVEEEKTLSQSEEQKLREQIEKRALELQGGKAASSAKSEETAKKVPKRTDDYGPSEHKAIREQVGEEISLKERVAKVRLSNTGKSLYIEFEGGGVASARACGRYRTNLGVEGMSVSELGGLEGKMVRIKGIVSVEFGTDRLIIDITSRDQVTELE